MTSTAPLKQLPPVRGEQDLVGTVVDGRYEVLSLLSEGGMGRLYDVEHVALGQRAVLKTILPKFARDRRVVERFLREAQAASRIGNPHIVDVRDSGTLPDGRAYYVMEFLEGRDARALIDERVVVEEEVVLDIACQVLSALEAAHSQGLVHRDLKPENIFVTPGSNGALHAKVVDFGLVRFTEVTNVAALTRAGELVGTPHYMSPEQCMGASVDIRSDLYALGLVMYEMVSGEVPYEEEELLQIVLRKTIDDYPPFGPLDKLASPEMRAILRRCLVADPEKRFPTPRDMLTSLEALRTSRSQLRSAPARLVPETVSPDRTMSDALLVTLAAPRHDTLPVNPFPQPMARGAFETVVQPGASMRAHRSFVRGAITAAATFALGTAAIVGLVLSMGTSEPLHATAAPPTAQAQEAETEFSPAEPVAPPETAAPLAPAPTALPAGVEPPEDLAQLTPTAVELPSPAPAVPAAHRPHPRLARPVHRASPIAEPAPTEPPTTAAAAEPPAPNDMSGLFNPWD